LLCIPLSAHIGCYCKGAMSCVTKTLWSVVGKGKKKERKGKRVRDKKGERKTESRRVVIAQMSRDDGSSKYKA
jgi:hypothetical protein